MKKIWLVVLMLAYVILGCSSAAISSDNGLVASYKFHESNGIDGKTVSDLSGNENNGTIAGNVDWQPFGDYKVLKMNGVDNVSFGKSEKLDISGKSLAFEVWFTSGKSDQSVPILCKFDTNWKTLYRGWGLYQEKDGRLRVWLGLNKTGNDAKAYDTKRGIIQAGVPYHVIVTYDGEFVCIYVNGQPMAKVPESREIAPNPSFPLLMQRSGYVGSRGQWAVDKIKVYNRALTSDEIIKSFEEDKKQGVYNIGSTDAIRGSGSRNLLINSTFTHCSNPGIPDWWGTALAKDIEKWDGCYGIDDNATPPLDGVKCLRIVNPIDKFWFTSTFTQLPARQYYTFSIYLKSSEPEMPVSLGGFAGKKVMVTREWQRYTASGLCVDPWGADIMRCVDITMEGKGTLWAAAPQLEYGKEATPYKPSDQDILTFSRSNSAAPLSTKVDEAGLGLVISGQSYPTISAARLSKTPVINGNMDEWDAVPVLKDFKVSSGSRAAVPTEAKVAYDDKYLYIGFKCPEPAADKIITKCKDSRGYIFNDDSIEIFLSTTPDSSDGYIQLAGNTAGILWAKDIEGEQCRYAARVGKGEWTAEIAIPFSQLAKRNIKLPWRLNLCRNRFAGLPAPEYSMWSCTGSTYHMPPKFGYLAGIDTGSIPYFSWSVNDIKLVAEPEGDISLTCKIGGKAAALKKISAEAEIRTPDGQKFTGAYTQAIRNGIPVKLAAGIQQAYTIGKYKVSINLIDKETKGIIASFNNEISDASISSPLHMLTRYSYYIKDANAPFRLAWGLDTPVKLDIEASDSAGKIYKPFKGTVDAGAFETKEIQIPLDKLPQGNYKVVAYALTGGKRIEVASESLAKLPPGPVDVRTDKFLRLVCIDGKPTMLHGQYFPLIVSWKGTAYNGVWKLADVRLHGFNTITVPGLPYAKIDENSQKFESFLNECRKQNLKVIIEIPRQAKAGGFESFKNNMLSYIGKFKNHPAVIGWFMVDEPDGWWKTKYKEEDMLKLYKAVKAEDPYRLTMYNWMFWPPVGTLDSSDVASLDRYPMRYSTLQFYPGVVSDVVSAMNRDAAPSGKPAMYYMQQRGYWDLSREPSVQEQKWTVYASFILGTRMLYHFEYKPMSTALWAAEKALTGELETVFERTVSPGARQVAQKTAGDFMYSLWKTGKGYMLVFANSGDKPAASTIQLVDLPERITISKCKPLAGSGKVSVEKGDIKVSLDGLDCGAYILE